MSEFHCHYKIPFDLGDQTTEIYFLTVGDESPRSQSLNDDILVRAFLLSCRLPIPPCPDMEGGGGHGEHSKREMETGFSQVSSYKNANPIKSEPKPTTALKLNYFLISPISTWSHWGLRL